ncbi:hypothetical protein BN1723_018702, partial [Verticillium longisporum]
MQYPSIMQPTRTRIEQVAPEDEPAPTPVFPRLPPAVARNAQVLDIYYESAPAGMAPSSSSKQRPAADFLAPFDGLSAVSDDIKDLLPPACRAAFDRAAQREVDWAARWGNETDVCARGEPIIDRAVVPFRSVYHQNAPTAADPIVGKVEVKKRRVNVNNTNWMLEHAREA